MYLQNITLKNFKCYESFEMDFHEKLTVIVGNNGAGKSSILEAAAIALSTMFIPMDGSQGLPITKSQALIRTYTSGSTVDVQPQYPVVIGASAVIDGAQVEWQRSLNTPNGKTTVREASQMIQVADRYIERLRSGDEALQLPLIAYYGTGRLWEYRREKKSEMSGISTRTNGYTDCTDGMTNGKLMMNWFTKMFFQQFQNRQMGLGGVPELEAVLSAMESCYRRITGHEDVKILYNVHTKELDLLYTDSEGSKKRMPINQLSDGYKCTISLVADIAYRMAVLNPQLLGNVCTETDGVVLIDEVDLHLHPAWQQRILGDLTAIFPKVQFIVSTHAAAVISSARSENLRILKDFQSLEVAAQIFGDDANSIMSRIMEVSERDPGVAEMLRLFDDLLAEGDFDGAEECLNRIDELRGGHDKEVSRNRVKLKLERIRGGQA